MAPQERDPHDRLTADEARVLEAARRRGFRALMLALDRLRPGSAEALGGAATAAEEAIRFRHDPSLAISTADVVAVREVELPAGTASAARPVVQVTTTFLGLTGEVSPLPPYMAEEVAQEVAQEEGAAPRREFLDLFHHRAISFLHRGVAKHDVPGGAHSDQGDAWAGRLLALLGRDEGPGARPADAPPRWTVLRCAPILAERAVTAAGLEACLADQFAGELAGAGIEVEQFVGAWVTLAPDERTRVGASASELGRSLVLGAQIYDRSGRFKVVVGPLDAAGYARFAAPALARRVRASAAALAGGDLDVELELRLAPEAAPGFVLSTDGRTQLGRNTWLGRQAVETRVTVDVGGAAA